MALGFIKKMFSFGTPEAEKPEAAPEEVKIPVAPEENRSAEAPAVEAIPAPIAEPAAQPVEELPASAAIIEPEPVLEPSTPDDVAPIVEQAAVEEVEAETLEELHVPVDVTVPHASPELAKTAPEFSEPSPSLHGRLLVSKTVEQKVEAEPEIIVKQSWLQRLRSGLSRSSRELGDNISGLFTKSRLTADIIEDLEDVLIRADLGVETAIKITDTLSSSRYAKQASEADVREVMAQEIERVLTPVAKPLELDLSHKPHVILVVGVNGTGKTTTIGKLAAKLTEGGVKVMLAAGDTFRAAAIEQLKIWGERTNSPVISTKLGADAAGLAFEAFEKAKEAGSDVLIIDTAGRLQNSAELMAELAKIVRVLKKLDPDAPHTVLQTVDATTGQNALNQVEIFGKIAGVNGLVMTKLDGSARGGILVAISAKHKLPVYFIGIGEQIDDLEPFSAGDFAKAIAGA